MPEKVYYWGFKLPFLGVIKAFKFRTEVPLEKRKTMHLYPGKFDQFVEQGVLDITLYNRWDVRKMKILKFFGILTSKNSVILIPDEYY